MLPPFARLLRLSPAALLTATLLAGCGTKPGPPAAGPAEKPRPETELSQTTLSRKAAESLGIRTKTIQNETVQEQRLLTGWVQARPGNEIVLAAPFAGYVRDPAKLRQVPAPGMTVQAKDELLTLEPILSPLDQIQLATLKRSVENDLAKAKESVAVAEAELKRVQGLVAEKLRGQQDLEQAQARLNHAKEDLAAAVDKQKLFEGAARVKGLAALASLSIEAPRAGQVVTLHASPGQYVPAAAPLVTIAEFTPWWVRVPVPEYDLPRLDQKKPATVIVPLPEPGTLRLKADWKPAERVFTATRVALVPQVDPLRHTADVIYELPAAAAKQLLAKDQMVSVYVPLGEEASETVVPYTAVVFDAYAGAWIYIEQTKDDAKEHVYERRRVELGPMTGAGVVIRPKLTDKDRVVVTGAAAIFSREFYKPPGTAPEKANGDDD